MGKPEGLTLFLRMNLRVAKALSKRDQNTINMPQKSLRRGRMLAYFLKITCQQKGAFMGDRGVSIRDMQDKKIATLDVVAIDWI